jgi:hypothetical protein
VRSSACCCCCCCCCWFTCPPLYLAAPVLANCLSTDIRRSVPAGALNSIGQVWPSFAIITESTTTVWHQKKMNCCCMNNTDGVM